LLVRTDLPLGAQLAQAGHAAVLAGTRFAPPEHAYLVVLGVPHQPALLDAVARLEAAGVRLAVFYEPDGGLGYTAACSAPVPAPLRRLFRRYALWTAPAAHPTGRGPPLSPPSPAPFRETIVPARRADSAR